MEPKLENYGIYAATKAAIETLTAILAKEMRGHSIGQVLRANGGLV